MTEAKKKDAWDGVIGGLLLVALGVLFMLHRFDVIHLGRVWQWWPYAVIAIGAFKMATWSSAERVASGFGLVLFGLWFLLTVQRWFGFNWSNSWPLALVAIGLSMVVRALLEPLFRRPAGDAPRGGGSHA
jgi:hypothetical protein